MKKIRQISWPVFSIALLQSAVSGCSDISHRVSTPKYHEMLVSDLTEGRHEVSATEFYGAAFDTICVYAQMLGYRQSQDLFDQRIKHELSDKWIYILLSGLEKSQVDWVHVESHRPRFEFEIPITDCISLEALRLIVFVNRDDRLYHIRVQQAEGIE